MAFTFCTSGAAKLKAGAGKTSDMGTTSDSITPTDLDNWSDEAESVICGAARIDLIDKWNNNQLTESGKHILQMLESAMVAQNILAFDMSGYFSRQEAEIVLDVLENQIRRGLSQITEDKIKTYLKAT